MKFLTVIALTCILCLSACSTKSNNNCRDLITSGEEAFRKGDLKKAKADLTEAVKLAEKSVPTDQSLGACLGDLAAVYGAEQNFSMATSLSKRALEADLKTYPADHEYIGFDLNNYGTFLGVVGDHAQGERILKQAVAVREKALGPKSDLLALTLGNLGEANLKLKHYPEAQDAYSRAIEIYWFNKQYGEVISVSSDLADVFDAQGKSKEAEAMLRKLVIRCRKETASNGAYTSMAMQKLAMYYEKHKKYALAQPIYLEIVEMLKKGAGEEHYVVLNALNYVAANQMHLKQYAKAEANLKYVIGVAKRTKQNRILAASMISYADCLKSTGRKAEGEKMAAEGEIMRKDLSENRNGPSYFSHQ